MICDQCEQPIAGLADLDKECKFHPGAYTNIGDPRDGPTSCAFLCCQIDKSTGAVTAGPVDNPSHPACVTAKHVARKFLCVKCGAVWTDEADKPACKRHTDTWEPTKWKGAKKEPGFWKCCKSNNSGEVGCSSDGATHQAAYQKRNASGRPMEQPKVLKF